MPGYSGAAAHSGRIEEKTYQVIKLSLQDMHEDGYDKVNYTPGTTVNTTLDVVALENNGAVPVGVLGSSVVVTRGDNIIGPPVPRATPGTTTPHLNQRPQGIVVRDVAGNPWEGTQTDEANRCTHDQGPHHHIAISLYETRKTVKATGQHSANPADDLTYVYGDLLYVNDYTGLLTKQVPEDNAGNTPINNPNGASPALAFDPSDERIGIYPFEYAEVIATNWEGTTRILIRLLARTG